MARFLSVVQCKGGVGKTTIAISLAGELRQRGLSVAVVDADPQGSASHWAEPHRLDFPVYRIPLREGEGPNWMRCLTQVDEEIAVIDTAPNQYSVKAGAIVGQLVLLPCTPSQLDIEATGRALNIVNTVRARRKFDCLPVLIVPNRLDPRSPEGQQLVPALSDLGEQIGPALCGRVAFVRACSIGESVAKFARGSAADREVKALASSVLRLVSLENDSWSAIA